MEEEKKKTGVEEELRALTDIIDKLEKGELSLEESLALFSEGVKRVKEARSLLSEAEERLKVLTEDGTVHDF